MVNRNEKTSIDDLEEVLKNNKEDTISIDIDGSETISSNLLSKLKQSKKTLSLNYDDGDNKYSLIVDGSKLKDFDELKTEVLFNSNYKKKIEKLSNYADGIYVSFKQKGNFPNGTKLVLYVGDKYSNGDKINLYYYDKYSNKLVSHIKNIPVKKGYIKIPLEKNSDYLFTMSNIEISKNNSMIPILIGISGIGLITFIIIIVMMIVKKHSYKNKQQDIIEKRSFSDRHE